MAKNESLDAILMTEKQLQAELSELKQRIDELLVRL